MMTNVRIVLVHEVLVNECSSLEEADNKIKEAMEIYPYSVVRYHDGYVDKLYFTDTLDEAENLQNKLGGKGSVHLMEKMN